MDRELLEDYDFPCSGDWQAFYREQEFGPQAVGQHSVEPLIPIVEPAKNGRPIIVRFEAPKRKPPQKQPKTLDWRPNG